jgi:hypothetical protein
MAIVYSDNQHNDTQHDDEYSTISMTLSEATLRILCQTDVCRIANCHSDVYRFAECHYPVCRYAECHYAVCHYAESRGAQIALPGNWDKGFNL